MAHTIYFVMEFHGMGDPYFGGMAADWALYKTEDGEQVFLSAADAQRKFQRTGLTTWDFETLPESIEIEQPIAS